MAGIKRWPVLVALFFLWQAVACQEADYQVVQLAQFIRHGARTGFHQMEEKTEAFYPGELTPNGERMTFALGKQVRSSYPNLFDGIQPAETEVYASSIPRCVQSAISQMMGVTGLGSGGRITPDDKADSKFVSPPIANFNSSLAGNFALPFGYSSGAFKISQKEMDFLFWPSCNDACPKLFKSAIVKYEEAAKKYDYLTVEISKSLNDAGFDSQKMVNKAKFGLNDLGSLYDDLLAYLYSTGSYYGNMTVSLSKQLETLASLRFYSFFSMEDIDRIWVDELARSLVKSFTDRSKGKSNTKYRLFSGHDTTVAALNLLFNLTSLKCLEELGNGKGDASNCLLLPPFASNYIFELALHKPSQKYFARVLLEGRPLNLASSDSEGRMPLTSFLATIRASLYYAKDDKMALCGNAYDGVPAQIVEVEEKMSFKYYVILAMFAVTIAALIGTFIALEVKHNKLERIAKAAARFD